MIHIVSRMTRREAGLWALIAALAGLLVGLLAGPAFAAQDEAGTAGGSAPATPEHTISVTGTGTVFVVPDTAELRLGVVIQKAKVVEARDAAAQTMARVVAALRKAGVAERDIQTSTYSLQPVYAYPANKAPRLTGYEIRSGLRVTVRDLDAAGPAIDAALGAGATTLDDLRLVVADPSAAEREAREAAVAAARAKADTLAEAADTRIVGVASITESVATPPWPYYRGAAIEDAAGTVVEPGTSEVEVTVSIAYLID